jgi:hypothetical protein
MAEDARAAPPAYLEALREVLPPPAYQPISYQTQRIAPPSPYYVTKEDFLHIMVWSLEAGAALHVHGRFLTLDGEIVPFTYELRRPTVGTRAAFNFPFTEGFLLSIQIVGEEVGTVRGCIWTSISIARGRHATPTISYLLTQGYLSYQESIGWPPGVFDISGRWPGCLTQYLLQAPATGHELDYDVPAYVRLKVHHIHVPLTTSSTVADRRVTLSLGYYGTPTFRTAPAPIHTAGLTRNYIFIPGWPLSETAFDDNGYVRIPLPFNVELDRYSDINTITTNFQSNDDFGSVRLKGEIILQQTA